MDEPLGSLDAITRNEIQKLILDIWEKYKITIVFVTHDVDEAIKLSTRILIMDDTIKGIKYDIKNKTSLIKEDIEIKQYNNLLKDKIIKSMNH